MPELYEYALARGKGVMAQGGPLAVRTNKTGRSPKDRFIVEDDLTRDTVWFSPETFGRLLQKMLAYAAERELFVQELYAGSDPAERLQVRFIQEMAYHSLFVHHMFVERASFQADWTVINILSFRADPETDGKSIFSVLNYLLPARGVMPMHCSANVGAAGDTALFFGLSGAGKTTLSADPRHSAGGPSRASSAHYLSDS